MAINTTKPRNNHGGRRHGSGRKKGLVAETKRTLAESAREYGQRMLQVLTEIAEDPEQPASSRVSAANHVLERGYGKAVSVEEPRNDNPLVTLIAEINRSASCSSPITANRYQDQHDGLQQAGR